MPPNPGLSASRVPITAQDAETIGKLLIEESQRISQEEAEEAASEAEEAAADELYYSLNKVGTELIVEIKILSC